MEQVPVISLNLASLEKNPGFHLTPALLAELITAVCYADLLMLLANQVRPYENNKGDTDKLIDVWTDKGGLRSAIHSRPRQD